MLGQQSSRPPRGRRLRTGTLPPVGRRNHTAATWRPTDDRLTLVPVCLVLVKLVRLSLLAEQDLSPADTRALVHLGAFLGKLALAPAEADEFELALDGLLLGGRPRREAGDGTVAMEAGDERGQDRDLCREVAGIGGGLLARVRQVECERRDGRQQQERVDQRERRRLGCARSKGAGSAAGLG